MKLELSPQWSEAPLVLEKWGDTLIVNGTEYDFGPLAESDILPMSAVDHDGWLLSDVTRKDGHITLTVSLPHGAVAPPQTLFPEPLVVDEDGPIVLSPYAVNIPDMPDPPMQEEVILGVPDPGQEDTE